MKIFTCVFPNIERNFPLFLKITSSFEKVLRPKETSEHQVLVDNSMKYNLKFKKSFR